MRLIPGLRWGGLREGGYSRWNGAGGGEVRAHATPEATGRAMVGVLRKALLGRVLMGMRLLNRLLHVMVLRLVVVVVMVVVVLVLGLVVVVVGLVVM